jgi:hypothetical protein
MGEFGEFGECADDHINVEWVRLLLELVAPLEIDVLPGNGGYLFSCFDA